MAAYLIFTADHEYFALATNEATRDAFLLELAISDHREGYAEPYDNYIRPECREHRTSREIAEEYRLIALATARRLGDAALVAKLEAVYVSEKGSGGMSDLEQIIGDALLALASNPHMTWHEKYLLCNRLATQCESAANAILEAEEARMAKEDEETERLIYATGGF